MGRMIIHQRLELLQGGGFSDCTMVPPPTTSLVVLYSGENLLRLWDYRSLDLGETGAGLYYPDGRRSFPSSVVPHPRQSGRELYISSG
jgi:hypothetical protein